MPCYPSVRLYYPGGKAGSFGVVARGILEGLRRLDVTHHALDYRETPDEDGFGAGGATADIGLYVGEPTHAHLMRGHARHRENLVLIAPNGLGVSQAVVNTVRRLELTPVSPSTWGAKVLASAFRRDHVEVFRHGVASAFLWSPDGSREPRPRRPSPAPVAQGGWLLTHVTSTASDRKGTLTLLRALSLPPLAHCSLLIKTDPFVASALQPHLQALRADVRSRILVETEDVSDEDMAALYALPRSVVVQPSWAEGFGLVPLEAAALGFPCITPFTSGQSDYRNDIVAVPVGPDKPLPPDLIPGEDQEGYPIHELDIADAVERFRTTHPRLALGAFVLRPAIAERWSWTAVVREFLERR